MSRVYSTTAVTKTSVTSVSTDALTSTSIFPSVSLPSPPHNSTLSTPVSVPFSKKANTTIADLVVQMANKVMDSDPVQNFVTWIAE